MGQGSGIDRDSQGDTVWMRKPRSAESRTGGAAGGNRGVKHWAELGRAGQNPSDPLCRPTPHHLGQHRVQGDVLSQKDPVASSALLAEGAEVGGQGQEPSPDMPFPASCPQSAASAPTHPWPQKKEIKKPRPARQETSNQRQCF